MLRVITNLDNLARDRVDVNKRAQRHNPEAAMNIPDTKEIDGSGEQHFVRSDDESSEASEEEQGEPDGLMGDADAAGLQPDEEEDAERALPRIVTDWACERKSH